MLCKRIPPPSRNEFTCFHSGYNFCCLSQSCFPSREQRYYGLIELEHKTFVWKLIKILEKQLFLLDLHKNTHFSIIAFISACPLRPHFKFGLLFAGPSPVWFKIGLFFEDPLALLFGLLSATPLAYVFRIWLSWPLVHVMSFGSFSAELFVTV